MPIEKHDKNRLSKKNLRYHHLSFMSLIRWTTTAEKSNGWELETHHWPSPAKSQDRHSTWREQCKSDLLQDERCEKKRKLKARMIESPSKNQKTRYIEMEFVQGSAYYSWKVLAQAHTEDIFESLQAEWRPPRWDRGKCAASAKEICAITCNSVTHPTANLHTPN